jgi:F-type H+-transporting ATPase subunit epsilon
MAANFELKVLSPSRALISSRAVALTLPGVSGYMTILPDHASMVAELDLGEVVLTSADTSTQRFFVAGGYVEVDSNRVTLLADVIEKEGEIEKSRAEAARKRAAERLNHLTPETDIERANRALMKADHRLLMASVLTSTART